MGTIKNGANGGFSGKAGSVVGSSWGKISYIKGLSKNRTKPASQLQLEQQVKFATAIKFLRPIKDMLNFTYGSKKVGKATGFNMALKQVITNALIGDYPEYDIDYAAVSLADGGLAPAEGSVTASPGGLIHIDWESSLNKFNGFADDTITLVIFDPLTNIYRNGTEEKTRADGTAELTMSPSMAGRTLHIYFFFTSRDGKKVSPSTYAGEVIVEN